MLKWMRIVFQYALLSEGIGHTITTKFRPPNIFKNDTCPASQKITISYGKNNNLPWKLLNFLLALQPEALVNINGRIDF